MIYLQKQELEATMSEKIRQKGKKSTEKNRMKMNLGTTLAEGKPKTLLTRDDGNLITLGSWRFGN